MMEKSPFSRVDQIGIVVRDLDKAVKYYESLGIGPFEPLGDLVYTKREVLGKPIKFDSIELDIRVARVGPVELELIEPIKGEFLWKEYLDTKGEGIMQLGFYVDDIDREESRLVEKGLKVIYRSRFNNGGLRYRRGRRCYSGANRVAGEVRVSRGHRLEPVYPRVGFLFLYLLLQQPVFHAVSQGEPASLDDVA